MPKQVHVVGEIRPSQMLHTYGVGAIVDLPNVSAMVLGLDDWQQPLPPAIGETRLLAATRRILGDQVEALRTLPVAEDDGMPTYGGVFQPPKGAPVRPFPRWLLCPSCRLLAPIESHLFDFKADPYRPERTRYMHTSCPKGRGSVALPVRFLTACPRGHLDEFPWEFFVHRGPSPCKSRLRLYEFGSLGDTSALRVKCETCGMNRQMLDAFGEKGRAALPQCRGRHPHLRDYDNGCDEQLTTILLGASNSWFGVTLSALTVPETGDPLGNLVDAHWHTLEEAESVQNVRLLRRVDRLAPFYAHSDEEVWERIERKRAGHDETAEAPRNLKVAEWRAFTDPALPSADNFRLRLVPAPARYDTHISRVILVERLREVRALIGFTRLIAPNDDDEDANLAEVRRVPLMRGATRWVPTAEVHGEGIFLQFDEATVEAWLSGKPDVYGREEAFHHAHTRWRAARHIENPQDSFPGLRYVLLHSFAHAFMRQVALECGYNIASLRERIYALPPIDENGPMAGILVYTAASDSEGTLGGLVRLGEQHELGRLIDATLQQLAYCASDPHCAEHSVGEGVTMHGASCHACLFVPETSCERGNRYLDRTLIVPTIKHRNLAFFPHVVEDG